ncbi:MAG: hypothetical protein QOD99_1617 [Chthoniobacter sp.]|nr:hypothetical protein [Chthoniobacter sp.]
MSSTSNMKSASVPILLRDLIVTRTLRKAGWRVVRVWECDLARKNWPLVAKRIRRALAVSRADAGTRSQLSTLP